jgi:hypothetical protein
MLEKSQFLANSASVDSKPKLVNRFWAIVDLNTSFILDRQLKERSIWTTVTGMVQNNLKAMQYSEKEVRVSGVSVY